MVRAPCATAPIGRAWTDRKRLRLCSVAGTNFERPQLMWPGNETWRVVGGTVHRIGIGSAWDFLPGHGLYIDMDGDRPDGTTFTPGRLASAAAFFLAPGEYQPKVSLAGCQPGDVNAAKGRFGDAYEELITLPSSAGLTSFARTVRISHAALARLSFQSNGADGYGLLLDDVELRRLR